MYALGTVLHGTNTAIGNLWIIVNDNTYDAHLLYDGRQGAFSQTNPKFDTMSAGMRIATLQDIDNAPGYNGMGTLFLPAAYSPMIHQCPLYQTAMSTAGLPVSQPINNPMIPSAIRPGSAPIAGSSLFGIDPAAWTDFKAPKPPTDDCPKSANGHKYKDYFGFTDNYHYCVNCDHKMRMKQ